MNKGRYQIGQYIKSHDFVKSPFRYAGGKFYALKQILPYLECVPHDEYREPFVGGGSIFFGKKKVEYNWINDLETDIIDIYKAFTNKDIINKFEDLLITEVATRERFEEIKNMNPVTFFEKVYKTFYINRTSYCGIINKPAWGYKEKKSSPPQNWYNFIIAVYSKLSDIKITNKDFEEIILAPKQGKSVLLYLDPPYYKADQKRAYTKSFVESDHLRLSELLRTTNYYFCLSYDDVEEIRDLYSWANIYEKQWLYNTANKQGEARQLGKELIITNYEVYSPSIFNF